jgi:hypothetical protein
LERKGEKKLLIINRSIDYTPANLKIKKKSSIRELDEESKF